MGGIAGWIDWQPHALATMPAQTHLDNMARTIAHRGGGDFGTMADVFGAFAQLPGPLVRVLTRDGARYAVVCDSLLGATAQLRRRLSKQGYAFEGESDAEVILAAYLLEGEACVASLNGSFAFVIWDGARHCAFAARDALGTKPLFYTVTEGGTAFASEIKALFAHPDCVPALDADGLKEVLAIGPGRTPGNGVFQGVHELLPGTCMRLDAAGVHPHTWWVLHGRPHIDTMEDTIEQVRALLLSSIRRQWPQTGGACALLSGGLDSSILTAVTAELAQGQLETFSFDYVDNDKNYRATSFQPEADAPYVQMVREHCGTRHQILLCDNDDLISALLPAMTARDLPGMADIDASLLYFCGQMAQRGQRIAFSGECADEIFGGYPWFYREEYLRANTFPWNTDPTA